MESNITAYYSSDYCQSVLYELEEKLCDFHDKYLDCGHVQYRFCIVCVRGGNWSDTLLHTIPVLDADTVQEIPDLPNRIVDFLNERGDTKLRVVSQCVSVGEGAVEPLPIEALRQLYGMFLEFDAEDVLHLPDELACLKKEPGNMDISIDADLLRE